MESTTKMRPSPSTLIITRDFYKQPFPPAGSICGNYLRAWQIFHAIMLPLLRGSWYGVDLYTDSGVVNSRSRTRRLLGVNRARNSTIMRRTRMRCDDGLYNAAALLGRPCFPRARGEGEINVRIKFQMRIMRIYFVIRLICPKCHRTPFDNDVASFFSPLEQLLQITIVWYEIFSNSQGRSGSFVAMSEISFYEVRVVGNAWSYRSSTWLVSSLLAWLIDAKFRKIWALNRESMTFCTWRSVLSSVETPAGQREEEVCCYSLLRFKILIISKEWWFVDALHFWIEKVPFNFFRIGNRESTTPVPKIAPPKLLVILIPIPTTICGCWRTNTNTIYW